MTNRISQRSARPVAIWLLVGIGMIMIQVSAWRDYKAYRIRIVDHGMEAYHGCPATHEPTRLERSI